MRSTDRPMLLAVASVLLLAFSASISGADDYPPYALNPEEAESIAFPPHPTRRLAGPDTNEAGLSLFEIEIAANTAGAPPHTHTHEDEFFYVRSGSVTFMFNEERKTVRAGGIALLPRNSLHAVWNAGDEDATLLVGTTGGKFGDYFDAVAIEVRKKNASTPQAVGEIMGRLGVERGVTIHMDKVPADVAALYGL